MLGLYGMYGMYGTSHKKFSEGRQAHVGMEALKTNQTRWESMTPQHFTPSLHLVPFCRSLHKYALLSVSCVQGFAEGCAVGSAGSAC